MASLLQIARNLRVGSSAHQMSRHVQRCLCQASSTTVAADGLSVSFPDDPDILYKSVDIETRGHDPAVLESYETFATSAAGHLDLTVAKTWIPDTVIWRRNVLKSVHIYKKAQVHFETNTHFRCWQLTNLTGSTADTYLEYVQRNLPEGVAMKVTKTEYVQLPDEVTLDIAKRHGEKASTY